jgi:hypothetical protein
MTLVPYQYVVLRCVPRVDREEFVNVGVALYSQAAEFLAVAHHIDGARLRAMAPDLDLESVTDSLATMSAVCRGETGDGRPDLGALGRRFGWLSAPRSTVIQPGPVHSGVTADPAATLEDLLARLVH